MDYGGNERRKTKKDLKRKRLNRGYKRGGQFRTHAVKETSEATGESEVSAKKKRKGRKNKK
jgi:hypothetical protein